MFLQGDFDWAALTAASDGISAVDLPRLNISSKQEAKRFLQAYGYDLDDLLAREEIWKIYFEAVSFLRNSLLEAGEEMPAELLVRGPHSDVIRLLMEASKPAPDRLGRWACAILRVMHIISHLDNDVRQESFQFAREQIFEKFDRCVNSLSNRRWAFKAGQESVTLVRYLKKERKDRNSTLIKLLSKPDAMVEAIYDRIGFRFVTENKSDVFRLTQMFFNAGVVAPSNIHPKRSFNTLLPLERFREMYEALKRRHKAEKMSETEIQYEVQKFEKEDGTALSPVRNPYSSSFYRALQFTCRQLIVAPDPTWRFWIELKVELEKNAQTMELLKEIPVTLREKKTFYYPFEIQVMDKESYVEAIGGRSRHREYKAKQRLMARNRVLRDLI